MNKDSKSMIPMITKPQTGGKKGTSIEYLGDEEPLVIVHKKVHDAMMALPHLPYFQYGDEGFGYATSLLEGMTAYVDQFFTYEQFVRTDQTKGDIGDIGKMFHAMIKAGKVQELNRLRVWFHFHPHGSTKPSGSYVTSDYGDLSMMKKFGRAADYMIMAIGTPEGHLSFDMFFYRPFPTRISNVNWVVYDPEYEKTVEELTAVLKGKVHRESQVQPTPVKKVVVTQSFAPGKPVVKRKSGMKKRRTQ